MAANPCASSVVAVAVVAAVAEPPVTASDVGFDEKGALTNEEEDACVSGEQHPSDSTKVGKIY